MKLSRLILVVGIFLFLYNLKAQERETLGILITDRPDATESPTVISRGYLQIETGGFYEEGENSGLKIENYTYNTTLLRYGLIKNVELRLGLDISKTEFSSELASDDPDFLSQNGFSPLLTGVKISIAEEKGWLPEIGFLGHIYLPFTASSDYMPETTGVDFRFSFAHTLSNKSAIAYNLGAAWRDDSPEANYEYTIAYGYSITSNFGIYIELYGDFPENNKANHLWDAGITYLITDNLQLDATVGSGITEGQNILLSAGASIRLPN